MDRNKLRAYLNFARRAGKLTLGVHAAESLRKCCLLIADEAVAPNNRKEIEKLQRKFSCPLLFVENLEELCGKANLRLAALREEHLAGAILKL